MKRTKKEEVLLDASEEEEKEEVKQQSKKKAKSKEAPKIKKKETEPYKSKICLAKSSETNISQELLVNTLAKFQAELLNSVKTMIDDKLAEISEESEPPLKKRRISTLFLRWMDQKIQRNASLKMKLRKSARLLESDWEANCVGQIRL